ncbi:MAG: DUF192 domain-containing protein [Halofilum sp. (in: g-proteobacteria)]|nr:DUF192 domain-containing protein [Halofilum sp. (in: g-proteobacteria)]
MDCRPHRGHRRRAVPAGVLVLVLAAAAWGQAGAPRIDDMPRIELRVDGRVYTVRLAATGAHRAAGFQFVPGARMSDEAIYFRYPRPTRPVYHMRNVARPLLLAWIAPGGRVHEVIRMQPGSTGHGPRRPVRAVLEYTADHPLADRVRPGVTVAPVPQSGATTSGG